ncbi:hypothetical protein AX16_000809 [Volvariella volvacea WC 439]|nr:hypothetical protein AX16_000809 [Volvariella volvacea WC 439]
MQPKTTSTTASPKPSPPFRNTPELSFLRKPESRLAQIFWRWRLWFESTFCLTMMEPWEKLITMAVISVLLTLLLTGLFKYLPQHLVVMQRRAVYYLFGQEGDEKLLWQLIGSAFGQANGGPGLLKEF